jgi:adenylosuccinate lyase
VSALSLVASTLGRLGNEIVELQRPEIGELAEPVAAEAVGSITMPHKRNPELSEHLVTLSRLVRANAGVILEGLVAEHERDGRGWKAEWIALPEVCLLTGVALDMGRRVLSGLEVDASAMLRNVEATGGMLGSEHLLASLAPSLGKHRAQTLLQEALAEGRRLGLSLKDAIAASDELRVHVDPAVLRPGELDTGAAGAMVDEVLEHARRARLGERDVWP